MRTNYEFSPDSLARVSEATREHMGIFAKALPHASGVLHGYRAEMPTHIGQETTDLLGEIQMSSRLVFAMTCAKTTYYMRGVITSVNDGNLLIAAQSLRAMIELSAMLRMTAHQLQPFIEKATRQGTFSTEEGREVLRQISLLLHGGKFDWETYFLQGAKAVLEGRDKPRGDGEIGAKDMLRVSKCIKHWAKADPWAGFTYDYLCDLVHPNKGSNLLMLENAGEHIAFGVDGTSKTGWLIFEQIFAPAAKLGMEGFATHNLVFAAIGKVDSGPLH
jgi:hypothetical protein